VFELAAVDVLEIVPRPFVLGLPVTGTLTPVSQVTLRSKVSAQVQENLVLEGETVRKGQLLLRLDQADLRTKLLNFDAQVEEAQAKLTMAEKTFASNEALLKQKYISQNAFDTTHNGVELAKAGLKAIVAQRQLALLALADAEVKSPVDGIVSMRHVQTGDKVSADSALVNLVNLSQMTLEANIASSEIPRIRIGQELSFQVDGFAERRFVGKVTRINPTALAGSRSMLVYLSVPNADLALKGGMFAKGNLALEKLKPIP